VRPLRGDCLRVSVGRRCPEELITVNALGFAIWRSYCGERKLAQNPLSHPPELMG